MFLIFLLLPQSFQNGTSINHKMKAIFEFAFSFLHNDAFILLFVPECKDVRTYSATYGFTLLRGQWGMNGMKLCSSIDVSV